MIDVSPGEPAGAVTAPTSVQFGSFRPSLQKFEKIHLRASAKLFDLVFVTFNGASGASVEASQLTSPDGQNYLRLQPAQMDRSNWFALEVALPNTVVSPGSVVVIVTDATCSEAISSHAVIRISDQSGETTDSASFKTTIDDTRATRVYSIELSEKFLMNTDTSKDVRAILFFERRSTTLNIFDIQVHCFNLHGGPRQAPAKPLNDAAPKASPETPPAPAASPVVKDSKPIAAPPVVAETSAVKAVDGASTVPPVESGAAGRVKDAAPLPPAPPRQEPVAAAVKGPARPTTPKGAEKTWALEPFAKPELIGQSVQIPRNADFVTGLRLNFPPTDQRPTLKVTDVNGRHVRHIDLTNIANLPWRSLEFYLGSVPIAELATLTIRASGSARIKLTPLFLVNNGAERSEFAMFQPISLSKEMGTYLQTSPMIALRSVLTPTSICRLALIIGGVCDDLAIETLEFATE